MSDKDNRAEEAKAKASGALEDGVLKILRKRDVKLPREISDVARALQDSRLWDANQKAYDYLRHNNLPADDDRAELIRGLGYRKIFGFHDARIVGGVLYFLHASYQRETGQETGQVTLFREPKGEPGSRETLHEQEILPGIADQSYGTRFFAREHELVFAEGRTLFRYDLKTKKTIHQSISGDSEIAAMLEGRISAN